MDNSGCADVFIGSAEHTIVQMPSTGGLGPYARVASLAPHSNQSILSAFHQAKKPANELVYSLSFDYGTLPWLIHVDETDRSMVCFTDFSVIPASNGPIYMRAGEELLHWCWLSTSLTRSRIDVTDMPGYWDSVVDSPPERKRWYVSRYDAIMIVLMLWA